MGKPDVGKSEETSNMKGSNSKCNSKQKQIGEKANEHPDWLPEGWDVEIRTRKSGPNMGSTYKCYIDPLNGHKFYSKPEVLRYLETIKDKSCRPKEEKKSTPKEEKKSTPKEEKKSTPKEEKKSTPKEEKKSTPKEEKKRTPREEKKCSPKEEEKCIPKEEKKGTPKEEKQCTPMEDEKCTPDEEKNITPKENKGTPREEKKKCTDVHSPSNVVVEKSAVEDLPPGWVKEVRIRKNRSGIRKDPFYIDPVSRYVFRSKKDVLRYLESGDIGACAYKPTRETQDGDNITPSPATKRQKLKQSAPMQQPVVAKEIFDKNSLELQDANSSRKGQDANVPSGMMDPPVTRGESVVKMQSREGGTAKKISDQGSSALLNNESLRQSGKKLSTDDVQEKEHVNMTQNANDKNHINRSISKKKVFSVGHRSSPRLTRIEPVQVTNNVINEQEVVSTSNNLSKDEAAFKEQPNQLETDKIEDKKPDSHTNSNKFTNKKAQQIPRRASKRLAETEGGSVSEIADHTPIREETANKRKKSTKVPPITDHHLEKLEDKEMDDEKLEPQLSFAFHYSWSDPNLEFAINTLTGVLQPVADSVDKGPTAVSETDSQKTLIDNVTERNTPVADSVGKGPTTVAETDSQKTLIDNVTGSSRDSRNNLYDNVTGSVSYSKPQVRSNKSKGKKDLKAPMRLSKRLAGLEPEVLPSERALEYSAKKSCKELKEEPIATATTTAILTGGASDHVDAGEATKHNHKASDSLKTEVLVESSSKSEKSYDAGAAHVEQLQKVEAGNIGDERSEPHTPLPFGDSWSDPCLEFAIKTLTGVLPVDAGADVLPVKTPDVDDPPNKELHHGVVTNINEETHSNSNQPQKKKELNMVSQPSKLLLGQPELRTTSISCETAPKFTTRESCVDEGNIIRNLNEEPQHVDAGNTAQLVHHYWNINTPTCEETLKGNSQVVQGEFITTEQPLLETGNGTINRDNSELQFCASLMNSWSDPCLEFAFKTLTGEIPVEDNLAIPGCFPEPSNCHERKDGGSTLPKDGGSTLPEFGSSSFSQSDIPFHYDIGMNSIPGQQPSVSSSFLPMDKPNLQGFAEVDPQKHYSQDNNNFQRK